MLSPIYTHKICGIFSSACSVKSIITTVHVSTLQRKTFGGVEMDTHADTCTLGCNFVKLQDTMQTVSVLPYNNKYEVVNDVPVVTAATAIQLHPTGKTVILVVNQSLWFGISLPNSLLNPNQL